MVISLNTFAAGYENEALPSSLKTADRFNGDMILGKIIQNYSDDLKKRGVSIKNELSKANGAEYVKLKSYEDRLSNTNNQNLEKTAKSIYQSYKNPLLIISKNTEAIINKNLKGEEDYFLKSVKKSMTGVKIPKDQANMISSYIRTASVELGKIDNNYDKSQFVRMINSGGSNYMVVFSPQYYKNLSDSSHYIVDDYLSRIDNSLSMSLKYAYREMPNQL